MNFDEAKKDPSSHFSAPSDILDHPALNRTQKIELLGQWEYDARELEVATEENMGGTSASRLPDILEALATLNADPHPDQGPTKQG